MKDQSDIILGTLGSMAAFTLGAINVFLGISAGLLTVGVMGLRFRKEWKNRNQPPKE